MNEPTADQDLDDDNLARYVFSTGNRFGAGHHKRRQERLAWIGRRSAPPKVWLHWAPVAWSKL